MTLQSFKCLYCHRELGTHPRVCEPKHERNLSCMPCNTIYYFNGYGELFSALIYYNIKPYSYICAYDFSNNTTSISKIKYAEYAGSNNNVLKLDKLLDVTPSTFPNFVKEKLKLYLVFS